MRNLLPRLAVAMAAVAPVAVALMVAPGSPCSTPCGNTLSSTSPGELVCTEGGYTGSSAGAVFQNCINCETSSTYVSGDETDVQYLLYNLRFNVGYCMWGKPLGNTKIQDNPCLTSTACLPLKNAVEHANYSSTAGPYDYCNAWAAGRVAACNSCLSNLDNGFYLRNYITMLDTGCQQRPINGSTLSIAGSPFDRRPVNATDPILTLATIPLPDYGPVSLGARVGIAFGGLALLLALVGFCIVLNGKRRRRAFLRTLERARAHHHHHGHHHGDPRGGDMLETPASQKPLTGWNAESPASVAATESPVFTAAPRYFSPYSSVYNSPVSGNPSSAAQAAWPALVPQGHMSPPPPPFSQWPSPTQEKVAMQMRSEQRQNEIAVGLALGGGMNNNPYTNGSFVFPPPPPGPPPVGERRGSSSSGDRKGKRREQEEEGGGGYEMESPYSGGVVVRGREGYKMPVEPEAPVLHHPGYGRQYLRAAGR